MMVQVHEVASIPLAVIKRQAELSDVRRLVPECCGLVWNVLREQQVRGGRYVAIYWDGTIRLEVGAEIDGPFSVSGEVVRSATPSGLVATTTHLGTYQTLHRAHTLIHEWCREKSVRLAGPSWEIYGHWQDEWNTDPSQIRTDVFFQVVKD
ncbi:MAG: GyrI-like domain-containing protein [Gemmatimonadota bacterium]